MTDLQSSSRFCFQGENRMFRLIPTTTNRKLMQRVLSSLHNQHVSMSNKAINDNPQSLPHLPVPELNKTLDKYLRTVKPFLSEQEFTNTTKLVKEFSKEKGIGQKLQELLTAKAKASANWLADWWLEAAYLGFRLPVVVFSSPGQTLPFENFQIEDDRVSYTSKLILAAASYKMLIDSNKIPTDMMGKDQLDMNQYRKIFGTCRIPALPNDKLQFNSTSKHIVVAHNNHFFKVVLFNEAGDLLSEKQLKTQLYEILEQSLHAASPVGVLTSEHRDNWATAYNELIKDAGNKQSIEEIQKSLFLVCLDAPMPITGTDNRQTVAGRQLIHGGGSVGNAANRWYDKTVQFVIGQDGIIGLTYEHSPSEGQPIAVMTDYLVQFIKKDSAKSLPDIQGNKPPQQLELVVNKTVEEAINKANDNIDKLAENLDLDCFTFKAFGKEFVKSQKLSPDSFIQIAMQYAFYRLHRQPGAHYESAATRKYIHGRTETIRSCSIESVAFAKIMLDSSKPDTEKAAALRAAILSHKQYSVDAVNGFGVDRHLLGLKLTALEKGIEIPNLYKDDAFVRSAHMRISSSQVATKCDGFMCYGPLVDDGYACCYNPRANDINIAVSAFCAHPDTSAAKFRRALETSLVDMHDLLVRTPKAKL